MASNVYFLHSRNGGLGHYIRLGHTGYRKLEDLQAADRLPIASAIVEANHAVNQTDLTRALKASGVELILDPKTGELGTVGGFSTGARRLPWANPSRPHKPDDFIPAQLAGFCDRIAEFAMIHQVDVVQAPTHFITSAFDPWTDVDNRACLELRDALDRQGGQRVRIDYPIITSYEVFRDEGFRQALISQLNGLPFDNLWLRISGFGMSATPAGVMRYIEAAWSLQELNHPIVADGVAGLAGLALCAFGAVGGVSHGIAGKDSFNHRDWLKTREDGGGSTSRIYLPNIDMYLYSDQAEVLFRNRGAKSLLGCNDSSCCPNGFRDMFDHSKAHALTQSARLLEALNGTPQTNWVDHHLNRQLGPAGLTARKLVAIQLNDDKLAERLRKQNKRLDLMSRALEDLRSDIDAAPQAKKPAKRTISPVPQHLDGPRL